ncbi:MAG: hypothetical protein K2U26_09390 [Cyclobacteriaceae bacterium]|nr:hypothetical protein [Cyclobacteriaceae bacterium]
MKKLTFIIPLFFSLTGFAQSATKTLDNLIATTKEGLQQAQEVVYDNQANSLKVGNWIIPLSQNTLTKVESENGQYEVEFSLQKGTAVTSATDANWKRASFALSLKSQELAEKFSSLFHELTEKGNDN